MALSDWFKFSPAPAAPRYATYPPTCPSFDNFVYALGSPPCLKQYPPIIEALKAWHKHMGYFGVYGGRGVVLKPDTPMVVRYFTQEYADKQYEEYVAQWKRNLAEFVARTSPPAPTSGISYVYNPTPEEREHIFEPIKELKGFTIDTRSPYFNFSFRKPFTLPDLQRFEGAYILAPPGRGKTNLLRHFILYDIKRDPHASVIIMDAKGELLDSFSRLKFIKDRIVYLEPSLDHPPAFNPLDFKGDSGELLNYIFSSLVEAEMTALQRSLLASVLMLLAEVPNVTLATLRELLRVTKPDGLTPFQDAIRRLDPEDQEFFHIDFNGPTYKETKAQLLWRLQSLGQNKYVRAMLRAPKTKIDFGRLMDEGRIILINNNYDLLGDQGAEFFGRLLLAYIWSAAKARSRRKGFKRPVYIYLDEAHCVIQRDTTIAKIIQQCRVQNIAMTFAHQGLYQIADPSAKSALLDCAIRIAYADEEAEELAPRLRTTPQFLHSLPKLSFAAFIRDVTKEAVRIDTTWLDLDATYEPMTDEEFAYVEGQAHALYCWNPNGPDFVPPPPPPPRDKAGDLHWTITVSPRIALKGGEHRLWVDADDGTRRKIEITVRAGTRHGAVLRVRGYGSLRPDRTRGDLYLTLRVPQRPDQERPTYRPFQLDAPPHGEGEEW